jgi:cytochrome c-type biogenesis protein CcmH
MVLLALMLLLVPLLRARGGQTLDRRAANVDVHRQRLQDLEAERDSGTIDDERFEQARAELERALLQDTAGADERQARVPTRTSRWVTAIIAGVAVPVLAVSLYMHFGRSDLLDPQVKVDKPADILKNPTALAYAANRLVGELRSHPEDAKRWTVLGLIYNALQRYEDAARAYNHAATLEPRNPDVLVNLAEAIAMTRNDNLSGRPEQLLKQALAIAPKHQKALWLYGIAQYRDTQYAEAIATWQKLLAELPADGRPAKLVTQNIAAAKKEQQALTTAETSGATVKVKVELDPKFAAKASPDTTVFIFARAVNGPPMPLAIVRKQVKDLPLTVTLSDAQSMSPMARISKFKQVMVSARVSPSGTAMPKSGDLLGSVGPVDVGGKTPITVNIDQTVP